MSYQYDLDSIYKVIKCLSCFGHIFIMNYLYTLSSFTCTVYRPIVLNVFKFF